MLFSTYEFIFFFLPLTVIGFYAIAGLGYSRLSIVWLTLASLLFYAWWNPVYLTLLIASISFNYAFGILLAKKGAGRHGTFFLGVGVAVNLGLLGYFKYSHFFIGNLNWIAGTDFVLEVIVLPLAISFFTFQQIAYLVDCRKGLATERDFISYCLFVSFFPQLIAGPIVHHAEMMPQFASKGARRVDWKNIAVGLTILTLGLFKKTVLADNLNGFATPVFQAAAEGPGIGALAAWQGVLAWSGQIYFDFSAYSDIAIGIGCMFGIRLPLNFDSPFKAKDFAEYRNRWHLTLNRFLRDYLYIPLGGSRKGEARLYINLILVMVIAGLWHGAAWTFVIWGLFQGLFLAADRLWKKTFNLSSRLPAWLKPSWSTVTWLVTLTAMLVSLTLFRVESTESLWTIFTALAGQDIALVEIRAVSVENFLKVLAILIFALTAPNIYQFMRDYQPALTASTAPLGRWTSRIVWRPGPLYAVLLGVIAFVAVLSMGTPLDFYYFRF